MASGFVHRYAKRLSRWIETDVDLDTMETTVRLNGENSNHYKTNDMVFSIQQFIAEGHWVSGSMDDSAA